MGTVNTSHETVRQPFIEHVRELRKRLFYSAAVLLVTSSIGWGLHVTLLHIIQKPLNQTLYYTSPAGGVTFIFKLCFYFGILLALPVIVYNLTKFLSPAIPKHPKRLFFSVVIWSTLLAACGVSFGYFISLPAALHFFTTFGGDNIQSLITADEYFNFVMSYLLAFALLFQIPLIVLFINRFTPLKPGKLMKLQRFVVLLSFILAAILTPTPDPVNQLIMAAPAIVLYQVAIIIVLIINVRQKKPASPAVVHTSAAARPTAHHPTQPARSPSMFAAQLPQPFNAHAATHMRSHPHSGIPAVRHPQRPVSDITPVVRRPAAHQGYTVQRPAVRSMDMVRPAVTTRLQTES